MLILIWGEVGIGKIPYSSLMAIFPLPTYGLALVVQLRDPENDFIFNFNFDDKMKIFEQFKFLTK